MFYALAKDKFKQKVPMIFFKMDKYNLNNGKKNITSIPCGLGRLY